MEDKENMTSALTVIRAEATPNYHVAPRTEAHSQVNVSPAMALMPTIAGMAGVIEKKKRGRPRKYGPDGAVGRSTSPMHVSASAPPFTAKGPSRKRGRGQLAGSDAAQQHSLIMGCTREGTVACNDGAHFTPHVITVNTGEDVTAKIISFCQQGPRAICILSANGTVSNATLRQSDTSGGTLTYEGRFEIVNLCGSFTPTEKDGARYRAGGLSVSLSSPNGRVVGGCIAGLLVAASPVQVIVGSFLPSNLLEHKPKKLKALPAPFPNVPALGAEKNGGCNRSEQNNPSSTLMHNPTTSPFQRNNWPSTNTMQDLRKSTTDINISLPGGMH